MKKRGKDLVGIYYNNYGASITHEYLYIYNDNEVTRYLLCKDLKKKINETLENYGYHDANRMRWLLDDVDMCDLYSERYKCYYKEGAQQ